MAEIDSMNIEIEKKYRLDAAQTELVCATLQKLNAQYIGEDFEVNNLFGGGALAKQQAILRLRNISGRTILTYKRRVESNFDVKQSIEHETEVENAEAIENIITCLGFERIIVYEKRRRTWKFREVEVVLDELPFGLFMEIEGSIMGIAEAEMFLGAEDFEVVHETYPNLTLSFGKVIGGVTESRFEVR